MERFERTIKIALAAPLLALLVTLGVLTATNNISPADLLSTASPTAQQVTATDTAAVKVETQASSAAALQQAEIIDARYAVQQAGDAVVTVVNNMQAATGRGRFAAPGMLPAEGFGSGIIISEQGYIVTNQHVVEGQQSLEVIFADGTRVPATLVGQDAYTDIAVVKVDVAVPAVARFADSDALELGQPVVAIGTALGDFENTVTQGIISGLDREIEDGGTALQGLVQTDAAINHGNSGGPLLDLSGNVVGVNTAVVRGDNSAGAVAEGLGFAVPSNTAKTVAEQLISSGSISHPYIGISYQEITPQVAAAYNLTAEQGLLVTDVVAGSPAQGAGLQAGSVITHLDGEALGSEGSSLVELLSKHKPGDTVTLSVIAPGSTGATDITLVLGERPATQ